MQREGVPWLIAVCMRVGRGRCSALTKGLSKPAIRFWRASGTGNSGRRWCTGGYIPHERLCCLAFVPTVILSLSLSPSPSLSSIHPLAAPGTQKGWHRATLCPAPAHPQSHSCRDEHGHIPGILALTRTRTHTGSIRGYTRMGSLTMTTQPRYDRHQETKTTSTPLLAPPLHHHAVDNSGTWPPQ